ncbi:hypothetical protein HJFPF1_01322 [Paramyrothecium foliicola]|nr:hypothetical protein HJFPF1_01322 [Paramyrothecium foliicola]
MAFKMMAPNWKRRNIVIGVCVLLIFVVALSSNPTFDPEKFKSIIPHRPAATDASDTKPPAEEPTGELSNSVKTSQLHFLIPASQSNVKLCYNVVSAIANRYPVPMLLGWHGTGLLDAHKTHLAKLRVIQKYLRKLEDHEDDDLVVIVDGYDIIMQLPPQIMIERYFQMVEKADKRLADRFKISVDEARSQGIRQTIFWGPDKICWPIDHNEPRCWAVPSSGLGDKAFGPKTGNGEMFFSDPRWLNSGTLIGPVDDVRALIDATMEEIEATYDPDYVHSESDQFYLANVWGRQEYYRSKAAVGEGDIPGGGKDRRPPHIRQDDQQTEFHVSIDYESALFQTKAGYEPFFGYMQFNGADHTSTQSRDLFEEGEDFEPYDIQMPPTVVSTMSKLYDDIADAHPGSDSSSWIRTVKLGTNFISKHIYALWHCTGPKEPIDLEYPKLWFFPFVKPLIKAAIKSSQHRDLIWEEPIDGRRWAPKTWFPDAETLQEEFGGTWSDVNGTTFVPWHQVCGEFEDTLFKGDRKAAPKPAEEVKKIEEPAKPVEEPKKDEEPPKPTEEPKKDEEPAKPEEPPKPAT